MRRIEIYSNYKVFPNESGFAVITPHLKEKHDMHARIDCRGLGMHALASDPVKCECDIVGAC